MKNVKRIWILFALQVAGFIVSVVLSDHFYSLRNGTAGFNSFCNFGSTMNCDVVGASKYAELIWGIPLSSFAGGWSVATAIIAVLALSPAWRNTAVHTLLGMTGFGAVMSVIYFVIMASVLKTWCIYCLVTDAINLVSLGIVLSMRPDKISRAGADRGHYKTYAGITAASLVITILVLKGAMDQQGNRGSVTDEEMVGSVLSTPPVDVGSGPEYPSIGPATAKVTIVEFSDFQCPFCKFGASILNTVKNRHPGQVRIVLRNFPLDSACNREVQHSMHPSACEAAKVAICANKQGKFQPVYEAIFENQGSLKPGVPTQLAKDAGLDQAQLGACMDSADTNAALGKDIEEGIRHGIQSTPTFFVNGRKLQGVMPVSAWSKVVEALSK